MSIFGNRFLDVPLFVYFGAFSVGRRGEWLANRERIPWDEYKKRYCETFNPSRFDAKALVECAKKAGCRYLVFTTRHHDGFCNWDTVTTNRKTTGISPCGRDLCAEVAEEVHKAGLKLGWYVSGADWYHPAYPKPYARDWPMRWDDTPEEDKLALRTMLQSQLKELLTKYGKIDMLWWDGCLPVPYDDPATINGLARELQPGILINERMDSDAKDTWDYAIAEHSLNPRSGLWEACTTINNHWGYHEGDDQCKTAQDLVSQLLKCSRNSGNFLLNIGPHPDGHIPQPCIDVLEDMGRWVKPRWESIANSQRHPFGFNQSCQTTVVGGSIYLHLPYAMPDQQLVYAEIANRVTAITLLPSGEPLPFEQDERGRLVIDDLPKQVGEGIASTIKIEVEGEPRAISEQESFWQPE